MHISLSSNIQNGMTLLKIDNTGQQILTDVMLLR
jgi:ABC-type xylose transport system permease subunit